MEAVRWRFYTAVGTFILLSQGTSGETGGYLFFNFLCYINPGHKVASGDICDTVPSSDCDPYFTICIGINSIIASSNEIIKENCQIYYFQTDVYDNAESVCNKYPDSRGVLRTQVRKALAYPLPDTFYVKILVKETDGWTSTEPSIASFSATFKESPASNLANPVYKEISMYRNEHRFLNNKAKLDISMAVQCERNLFGSHCITRCAETLLYSCSANGAKICKEGWMGQDCMSKDLCLYQMCAHNAKCMIVDNSAKCMCNDQTMGPHCYPNYDPCRNYKCENEGLCKPNGTGDQVHCKCYTPYYGKHCELELDICQNIHCQNNGTCEMNIYGNAQCNCHDGFSGLFCANTNSSVFNTTWTTSSSQTVKIVDSSIVIVLSVLFGLSLVCCATIAFLYVCRQRRKRNFHTMSRPLQPVKMKDLEAKLNSPKSTDNVYLANNTAETTVYETVDDYKTYSYLRDNNDDYLVPSRPNTPAFDTYGRPDSPVYLQMTSTIDASLNSPEVNRESFDLPPLPSRELHRKLSLKKFCLS